MLRCLIGAVRVVVMGGRLVWPLQNRMLKQQPTSPTEPGGDMGGCPVGAGLTAFIGHTRCTFGSEISRPESGQMRPRAMHELRAIQTLITRSDSWILGKSYTPRRLHTRMGLYQIWSTAIHDSPRTIPQPCPKSQLTKIDRGLISLGLGWADWSMEATSTRV